MVDPPLPRVGQRSMEAASYHTPTPWKNFDACSIYFIYSNEIFEKCAIVPPIPVEHLFFIDKLITWIEYCIII